MPRPPLRAVAELDLPGETGRQARVFAIWALCLFVAVLAGISARPRGSGLDVTSPELAQELARSRAARLKIAALLGLGLPVLLTLALAHRHRRGGAHARGIVVDVTEEGELRVWGRGYGTRVRVVGATVDERLVDVYAGRLGAWRQRRLRVRSGSLHHAGARDLEIATLATPDDAAADLPLEGGEGDCIEVGRRDYDQLRGRVLELASEEPEPGGAKSAKSAGDSG